MIFFEAAILGIIEGLTEFLPVSSTGHLILAEHILNIPQTPFVKTFTIAIQLGAILAVISMYGGKLLRDRVLLRKILTAFIPTGIIGFLLYKTIKEYLIGNAVVVCWALIIGGLLLILFDRFFKPAETKNEISYKTAFMIGCCQSLAAIPGVSRSASAIIGGLLAGVRKDLIVEFSFMLAIPTMIMATGYDLLKTGPELLSGDILMLIAGAGISFFVALFGIKFLLKFVTKHGFAPFGIYRIALGISFLALYY